MLAYAALEWVLIALLLINGLLAYAVAVAQEASRRGDAGTAVGLSYYAGVVDAWGTGWGATGASNGRCVRPQA
jgi:hypothetical protein